MNLTFDTDRIFFTSDTHFHHAKVIDYCNRPFKDVEQMNDTLIANWNRVVGRDDVIFHLGDFSFGGAAKWSEILDLLNGKIYLIIGNHDAKRIPQTIIPRFEDVSLQMLIEVCKQKICLNHNPFLCYSGSYTNVWQLFGHVHSGPYHVNKDTARLKMLFPRQYDVGVDNNNYTPVSFSQVKSIIDRQIEDSKK